VAPPASAGASLPPLASFSSLSCLTTLAIGLSFSVSAWSIKVMIGKPIREADLTRLSGSPIKKAIIGTALIHPVFMLKREMKNY